jgi:hypothetical protein
MAGLTLLSRKARTASGTLRLSLPFLLSSVAVCALTAPAAAQTAPLTGPAISYFQNTGTNGLSGQNADACSYPPYSGTIGNPSDSVFTNFSTGLTSGTEYFATLLLMTVTGGQGGAGEVAAAAMAASPVALPGMAGQPTPPSVWRRAPLPSSIPASS